jgi:hypothetical protein
MKNLTFLETIISEEVRAAAAHAAHKAAQLAKSSVSESSATSRTGSTRSGPKRALPEPSSFGILPSSFYDEEDVISASNLI